MKLYEQYNSLVELSSSTIVKSSFCLGEIIKELICSFWSKITTKKGRNWERTRDRTRQSLSRLSIWLGETILKVSSVGLFSSYKIGQVLLLRIRVKGNCEVMNYSLLEKLLVIEGGIMQWEGIGIYNALIVMEWREMWMHDSQAYLYEKHIAR